jgi:hypothetical protein
MNVGSDRSPQRAGHVGRPGHGSEREELQFLAPLRPTSLQALPERGERDRHRRQRHHAGDRDAPRLQLPGERFESGGWSRRDQQVEWRHQKCRAHHIPVRFDAGHEGVAVGRVREAAGGAQQQVVLALRRLERRKYAIVERTGIAEALDLHRAVEAVVTRAGARDRRP